METETEEEGEVEEEEETKEERLEREFHQSLDCEACDIIAKAALGVKSAPKHVVKRKWQCDLCCSSFLHPTMIQNRKKKTEKIPV